MKAIKYISSEDVIAIDIETVRIKESYNDLSDDFKSAWEYKNKQNGEVPDYEELCDLWVKTASLYPEFSKVCSVVLAYLKGDELRVKQYTSEHEFLILDELSKDLNIFIKHKPKSRLIGHASKFFDFPFLCKRYIINQMDIPSILDESDAKPWEQTLLCTNDLWKSFGAFNNHGSSLQGLCVALNIPVSKVDLVGDEVGKAYYDNELERIGDYCALDTIATFNIFRRFKKESIFYSDKVVYSNTEKLLTIDNRVKSEDTPIIYDIFNKGSITVKQMGELNNIIKGFSESEKTNLKLILRACLKDNPTDKEIEFLNKI